MIIIIIEKQFDYLILSNSYLSLIKHISIHKYKPYKIKWNIAQSPNRYEIKITVTYAISSRVHQPYPGGATVANQ